MFKDELQYELAMMAIESAIDEDLAEIEALESANDTDTFEVFESLGLDFLLEAEDGEAAPVEGEEKKEEKKAGLGEKVAGGAKKVVAAIKAFFVNVKNFFKQIVTRVTDFVKSMSVKGLEKKLKNVKEVTMIKKDSEIISSMKSLTALLVTEVTNGVAATKVSEKEHDAAKGDAAAQIQMLLKSDAKETVKVSGTEILAGIKATADAISTVNKNIGKWESGLIKKANASKEGEELKAANASRAKTMKEINGFMSLASKSLGVVMAAVARGVKDDKKADKDAKKGKKEEAPETPEAEA